MTLLRPVMVRGKKQTVSQSEAGPISEGFYASTAAP